MCLFYRRGSWGTVSSLSILPLSQGQMVKHSTHFDKKPCFTDETFIFANHPKTRTYSHQKYWLNYGSNFQWDGKKGENKKHKDVLRTNRSIWVVWKSLPSHNMIWWMMMPSFHLILQAKSRPKTRRCLKLSNSILWHSIPAQS